MSSDKRPPNIVALTKDRISKVINHRVALRRVQRLCGAEPQDVAAEGAAAERRTRSKDQKISFLLSIPDCPDCNLRNIEAFQEEFFELKKKRPLLCEHGKNIMNISPLGHIESPTYPAIVIPAMTAQGGPSAARIRSTPSTLSSVTFEKLEREKEVLTKAFEELCEVHNQLAQEVEQVQRDLLVGYEDKNSADALENFLDPYTDRHTDVHTLVDSKIEELQRLSEVESVFNGGASDDTRARVEDWTTANVEQELTALGMMGRQPREQHPSNSAHVGSPDRLQREQLAQDRIQLEQLEQDRLQREQLERDRLQREQLERDRLQREQDRLQHEQLEQERIQQESSVQERLGQATSVPSAPFAHSTLTQIQSTLETSNQSSANTVIPRMGNPVTTSNVESRQPETGLGGVPTVRYLCLQDQVKCCILCTEEGQQYKPSLLPLKLRSKQLPLPSRTELLRG